MLVADPPAASNASVVNLLALSRPALEGLVRELGWPRYRAQQILRWLYRGRVRRVEDMTDLRKTERQRLAEVARVERLLTHETLRATDGTRKIISRLRDGLRVETVLIPDDERLTVCVSTQVGCTLDCTFCLTATMGLHRNLAAHEIVDQVLGALDHLEAGERLTNLVMMGMGEPLANAEAVGEAIARLTDPDWGVGIPPRRITLSTAGLASRLEHVARWGVNLAVSLNATTAEQRRRLMPRAERLHSLDRLLQACRAYPLPPRRRLTFEYVLLAETNDSATDARRLAQLLRGIRCKINLIPFNEFPGSLYRRPREESVLAFQGILQRAGYDVFIRQSKGRDVLGACGQLGEAPTLLMPAGSRCS